jgi:alpha-beta hydrolase superfamily lysophospholipase
MQETMRPPGKMLALADGCRLFVRDDLPDGPCCGHLLLMHGLGEHAGRYAHVVRFFTERGYAVRRYDHRGHGHSDGARGDVPDSETLLADAQAVLDDWQLAADEAPPVLLGHSMGGLLAARFAVERRAPLSALVLSSPALGLRLSRVQRLLLKVMRALAPGLALPNGLPARFLSHDAAVVRAYLDDALVHNKISARLLCAMLDAIEVAQQGAASLALPTLLLASGDDQLVDPAGSDTFFRQLPAGKSVQRIYPQLYHELFNEIGAAPVFADLDRWLSGLQEKLPA